MEANGDLASRVSTQVFLTGLMERLVHDDGPWQVVARRYGSDCPGTLDCPADRHITDDSVVLVADFGQPIGTSIVEVLCAGRTVQVLPVDPDATEVRWEAHLVPVAA